jgi:serine/threonine protein kinase
MAPEQMRSSRRVDGRTDIWGLGTIMHELLAGAPPFVASSMPELFAMILQDPAPRLRDRRADIPVALDDIVLRCLEKSPDRRPASVLELAQLLAPFASSLSAGAAERVARVGKNTAIASERNIAAVERARESSPELKVAIAPSSPELAHANTTRFAAPSVLGEGWRSRALLAAVIGTVATVVIGGATAGAVIFVLERSHAANQHGVTTTTTAQTTSPSVGADLPPPAIDPLPPATGAEPSNEGTPATTSSVASSPSAALLAKRPGLRPTKGASSAGGSAAPAGSTVPSAQPVRPATTASSRYD